MRFHVDGGDVVALLCLTPAKSGGLSRIASSTTVWNEIVRALGGSIVLRNRGEPVQGLDAVVRLPLADNPSA